MCFLLIALYKKSYNNNYGNGVGIFPNELNVTKRSRRCVAPARNDGDQSEKRNRGKENLKKEK